MDDPNPTAPDPDLASAGDESAPDAPRGITKEQLPERLRAAVDRAGWPALMPVQAEAIPMLLDGRNVMVQARTGSGKTGAFLLPMLDRLDPSRDSCQALILVPTRELASQVWQQAEVIFADTPFRTVAVYGGVGYGPQTDALRGGAHVVVGTPGRVLDHLLKRNFDLDDLRMLIFDEADRMLSMGFYPDMRQVQRYLPKRPLQGCMFSATFPAAVLRTAEQFIKEPEFLSLSQDHVHVTDIEHVFYNIPGTDKDRSLVRFIEIENPTSAIIFCNTKAKVHYVSVVLKRFGYDADEISADLSQADRERVLERVRKGNLRFLVATDVAGRGLDIPDLSHVIQYEPPEDPESYIHRAGRTGRAGAGGVAVSLVYAMESLALARIAAGYGIDIQERPLPTDADVEAIVSERLTALLEARLRERDKLQTERSRRFIALGRALAESEDESAIIAMLLDEMYQQLLHAPVDGPPAAPVAARRSTSSPSRDAREPRESREARGPREERPAQGRAAGDRNDRPERPERTERPDRTESVARPERAERPEFGQRPESAERPERAESMEPPAPVDRPERIERSSAEVDAEPPVRPAASYYRTVPPPPAPSERGNIRSRADAGGTGSPSASIPPSTTGEGPSAAPDEGAPRRRRRRGGRGGAGGLTSEP